MRTRKLGIINNIDIYFAKREKVHKEKAPKLNIVTVTRMKQFIYVKNVQLLSITDQYFEIYLGHTKISEGGTFFSCRKLEKIFFFYEQVERLSLYLSMLFDHYSTNVMIMKLP